MAVAPPPGGAGVCGGRDRECTRAWLPCSSLVLSAEHSHPNTTRHGTLTCTCPRTQTRHRKASRRRLSLCCWRRPAQALPSQRCRLRSSENLTCFENETETAARINMYKKRVWILGWGPSLDKRANAFIPPQKRALSWQTKQRTTLLGNLDHCSSGTWRDLEPTRSCARVVGRRARLCARPQNRAPALPGYDRKGPQSHRA